MKERIFSTVIGIALFVFVSFHIIVLITDSLHKPILNEYRTCMSPHTLQIMKCSECNYTGCPTSECQVYGNLGFWGI